MNESQLSIEEAYLSSVLKESSLLCYFNPDEWENKQEFIQHLNSGPFKKILNKYLQTPISDDLIYNMSEDITEYLYLLVESNVLRKNALNKWKYYEDV